MANNANLALRRRLFEAGRDSLARITTRMPPELQGGYMCPVCHVVGFEAAIEKQGQEEPLLTVDHVPPSSIGPPNIKVLTCKSCNNLAGQELDSNIRMKRYLSGELGVDSAFRGQARIGDVVANVMFTVDADGLKVTLDANQNAPGIPELVKAGIASGANEGSLTSKDGFYPAKEEVGLLRIAYLVAFSVFGYTYILGKSLERVRAQIREPDVIHMPPSWRRFSGSVTPQRRLLWCPAPVPAIGVQIDRDLVLLPLHGMMDLYERLESLSSTDDITFAGSRDFPRFPLYINDRRPRVYLETVEAAS